VFSVAIAVCAGGAATAVAETASQALTITEVFMAAQAAANAPEERTTSFRRDSGFVFCIVRLENPSRGGNELIVTFEPAAGEPGPSTRGIRLRIPPIQRYRTMARTGSLMAPGAYRCVVRDREGAVLSQTPFQITE
jgi:hypothetical protein